MCFMYYCCLQGNENPLLFKEWDISSCNMQQSRILDSSMTTVAEWTVNQYALITHHFYQWFMMANSCSAGSGIHLSLSSARTRCGSECHFAPLSLELQSSTLGEFFEIYLCDSGNLHLGSDLPKWFLVLVGNPSLWFERGNIGRDFP